MFWRTVHYYGQDAHNVMQWPIRMFWSSVRHVDRLRADTDLRLLNSLLTSAISAQSSEKETLESYREAMGDALGTPMKFEDIQSSEDEILKFLGKVK